MSRNSSPRSRSKNQTSPGCIVAFCSFFVLIGLVIFFTLSVRPAYQVFVAGDWIEVPCVITKSEVERHSDSEGDTFTIEIEYTYFLDGAEFRGDRYDFDLSSNNDREFPDAVVARYPVGSDQVCYVDPGAPEDAVLDRSFGDFIFVGFFGFVFMAVPLFIMFIALRSHRRQTGPRSARVRGTSSRSKVAASTLPTDSTGFVELKRESSRGQRAFFLCFIAIFWNGIVSVFLVQAIGMDGGAFRWGMTLFMIPFLLVGIGLLFGAGHALLALFNPIATLTLRRAEIYPGELVEFAWEFTGRVEKIERLEITFVGRERATYRVGTDTRTDEHRFHVETCIERAVGEDLSFGTEALAIPADTLPTFKSSNNEVQWFLELKAEIARWPDVKSVFPVPILPHPIDDAGAKEGAR